MLPILELVAGIQHIHEEIEDDNDLLHDIQKQILFGTQQKTIIILRHKLMMQAILLQKPIQNLWLIHESIILHLIHPIISQQQVYHGA
jgi:hypothetical protein